MTRTIKQYYVTVKSKSHPEWGQRRVVVNSPTKQWIKDNWVQICGNPDFRLVSIDLPNTQQRYTYA